MSEPARAARFGAGICCAMLLSWLAGCAQLVPQTMGLRTGWPEQVPQQVELTAVPFFPQDDYQCGPAALATVLSHSGVVITPEPLVTQVYVPARKGSLQLEMLAAPRRYGRVSYRLAPRYADLLREVAAGNPVVVLQDVGPMFTQWHYAVVNGFHYPSGTLLLRSGKLARQEMPFTYFERTWIKSGYWAMVAMPPDRIPVTATEEGWMAAVLAMARVDKSDAATKAYSAALKRWPDNLAAAIGLANQHHARGALAEAAAVLRQARQRHPQSVIVMNNLAQTLSDQGRHGEALAQIDKAVDPASPFAAEVRSTRQMILQRMGQRKAGSR
jgi:tetratricopeptide (TPR) repeat protein